MGSIRSRFLPESGSGSENLTDKNEPIGLIMLFIWVIVAFYFIKNVVSIVLTIVYIINPAGSVEAERLNRLPVEFERVLIWLFLFRCCE